MLFLVGDPGSRLHWRMDISLTWKDFVQLGLGHKVERDGFTLAVARPLLPTLKTSPDGLTGSVTFTVDESDSRHKD